MFRRETMHVCLAPISSILVICVLLQSHACAQKHDPLELLRRFPPDPALHKPSAIAMGKVMLKWKIRRIAMNLNRLEAEMQDLEKRIEQQEARSASKNARLDEFAFATDAVRGQLLEHVLGRLLEARVDIAAKEALAQHLDDQLKKSSPGESARIAYGAQRDALTKTLSLLSDNAARMKSIFHKNTNPTKVSDAIVRSQIEILNVKAKIAELAANAETSNRRRAAEIATPLSDVRLELHELEAREGTLERQLEDLATAAGTARELRRIQREIDRLNQRLDIRTRRYEELSMEVEEATLLRHAIAAEDKDNGRPPESHSREDE